MVSKTLRGHTGKIALIVLALATAALSGCTGTDSETSDNTSALFVKDALTDDAAKVFVTFTKAQVKAEGAGWTTVFEGKKSIDLLALSSADAKEGLSEFTIDAGAYEGLRVAVSEVTVIGHDGSERLLNVFGNVIQVSGAFTVDADGTDILIDFDLEEGVDLTAGTFTPKVKSVQTSDKDTDGDGINDVDDTDDDGDGLEDNVDDDINGDGMEDAPVQHAAATEEEACENQLDDLMDGLEDLFDELMDAADDAYEMAMDNEQSTEEDFAAAEAAYAAAEEQAEAIIQEAMDAFEAVSAECLMLEGEVEFSPYEHEESYEDEFECEYEEGDADGHSDMEMCKEFHESCEEETVHDSESGETYTETYCESEEVCEVESEEELSDEEVDEYCGSEFEDEGEWTCTESEGVDENGDTYTEETCESESTCYEDEDGTVKCYAGEDPCMDPETHQDMCAGEDPCMDPETGEDTCAGDDPCMDPETGEDMCATDDQDPCADPETADESCHHDDGHSHGP